MSKTGDYGAKVRLLRIMRALLERPYAYTRSKLAEIYGVSPDTITNDFEAFRNAGFVLHYDNKYRYAFKEDQPYRELRSLLHFSEEDQVLLETAIDQIATHNERGRKLKAKLASLYDYQKLGHSYLRKPYLKKVDALLEAKRTKRQVILEGYHSSSSEGIMDRRIEPFYPHPPDDTIYAFDVDKKELKNFLFSRFVRVKLTDDPWEYESHHTIRKTDVFRVVDSNQVPVILKFGVAARNELVERFPMAKGAIEEAAEPNMFFFQTEVNHRFLGLANFILGNYHLKIDVLEPESLQDHLRNMVGRMTF